MFNEMIRRIGVKTYGSPKWFRNIATPLAGPFAQKFPAAFYAGVLAGEEPIDHIQRTLTDMVDDGRADIHPMVYKVMSVHIEEESRHIMGAEKLMEEYLPKMSERQINSFAKTYPALARAGINATLLPSDETLRYMGVPKPVAKQVWFDSDSGRQVLQDLSFRARRRAERLGLRTDERLGKTGKKAWEICGVDGPTSHA